MSEKEQKKLISKILTILKGFTVSEIRALLMSVETEIEEKQKITIS